MTVSEFIKSFNELSNPDLKTNVVKQHIKRTYSPIVEKIAVLQELLKKCVMVDRNGIPYLDMVTNKINFIYAIVVLYTDLEPDKSLDGKQDVLRIYDLMQESGAIDILCDLIGSKEINELTFTNKELLDTWYNANSSTRSYLATLTDKAVRTFVELSELLGREKIDLAPDKIMNFFGIAEQTKEE